MKILAIIRTELWQRRRGLLFWSIGVAALVGIDMLLYLSFKNEAQQLDQLLKGMSGVMKFFSDDDSILSPAGYLSSQVFYLLLPVVLIICTVGLGSGLIGKDEQQGTLEYLLARPVSRFKLLLGKLLAGSAMLGLLGAVALITALICWKIVGFEGISAHGIIFTTLDATALAGLIGSAAFCVSCLGRPLRTLSTPLAVLFAFGGYMLASLESVASWIQWPAKLFPYHYYNPSTVLAGHSYGLKLLAGYVICSILLIVIGWIGFRRRDIG